MDAGGGGGEARGHEANKAKRGKALLSINRNFQGEHYLSYGYIKANSIQV